MTKRREIQFAVL